jgi:dihydroorotase
MDLLLKGGRVIDPSLAPASSIDRAVDVRVAGGRIAEIGASLAARAGERAIALDGLLVAPGLIDLHVHLREPGHEYKEDIETGTRAAVRGGYTTVCCMPNTAPVNDDRTVTERIVRRAREAGACRVRPVGAISRGLAGEALADIADMKEGGIVAISDDGRPVMNAGLLRRAMEYARTFDLPVVQHAEDLDLAEGGAMNEGAMATRLGVRAQPACAESAMVARDLELVAWTGARYHVAHVSAARTIALVREARRRGLPVTCEVTPHHLTMTDDALATYDTCCKVMPPLREAADVAALLEGLADGTIDCVATDHAPHSPVEKDVELEAASPGMIGLETAAATVLGLVRSGAIGLVRAIELLTWGGARCFGLDGEGAGTLRVGAPADLCVLDPARRWRVEAAQLASRSRNTPLLGVELTGRALLTLVGGAPVHDLDGRLA